MKKWAAVVGVIALTGLAFVGGRYSDRLGHPAGRSAGRVLYYSDPMHPSYRSDKPGVAPDCGMPLVPVYDEPDPGAARPTTPGSISITPDQQRLIGVRVETVKKEAGQRVVRATGRVEVDSDRLFRLMAGTEGWVRTVLNNPVGTQVKKDEPLATLYSREFRNAQQAYLGSIASLEHMRALRDTEEVGKTTDASLRINEEQLRALGMGEAQIKELRKTRQLTSEISVNAPVDGFVLSRDISPGQRFEMGTEFYRIADLSKVWITADIFGEEARMFRPDTKVRVTVREGAATVYAIVSKAPPFFDPASRTLKLRLEADNPGFALRPDMFVDLELPIRSAPALTIPIEALLDSGLTERVFVERAQGQFEPRVVETGWRTGERVEIVNGLKEGERIVASGTFLVDSESQLKAPAGSVRP